jgi:putative ATP-dependent endonuclease of OLD family
MRIATLEVANYRGIASASIDFDETTVLIGENDCGRSSLLSALHLALASGEPGKPLLQDHHFHRNPEGDFAGPLAISLKMVETRAGEWDAERLPALRALLGPAGPERRSLFLRIEADPLSAREACWVITGAVGEGRNLPAQLAELRQLCPLVWLQGGLLLGCTPTGAGGDPGPLAEAVETHYRALIEGTGSDHAELLAGFEAARELLRQRRQGEAAGATGLLGSIAALVEARGGPRPAGLRYHGSAAQQLAILILVAAFLRPPAARPEIASTPVVVIEDPETHLHPITLASAWGLLQRMPAQRIIGTHSEAFLAHADLLQLRRLVRCDGRVRQHRLRRGVLDDEGLRKLGYHIRARRGEALYARSWLLVEGETEFWLMPELARLAGYELALEGVAVVEYAQCGLEPLIRLADELDIGWHLLAEGDSTGRNYADEARKLAGPEREDRLTRLKEPTIEHCLWKHGYAEVFLKAAGVHPSPHHKISAARVIARAIKRHSKPFLAFEVLEASSSGKQPGVPRPLRRAIEASVHLARRGTQP